MNALEPREPRQGRHTVSPWREKLLKTGRKTKDLSQRRKVAKARKEIPEVRVRFSLRLSPALREEDVDSFRPSEEQG
jgi:hypothetical protein